MNYCSDCDIAYEEKYCPLCIAKDGIKSLEKKIEELEEEIAGEEI